MKSLRILTLFALPLHRRFAAEFRLRAGRYNDGDEEFVGAELLFDAGAININPNIEYSLADDITAGSANLDLTFDLGNIGASRPTSAPASASPTPTTTPPPDRLLGNLIGGVSFNLDS